MPRPFIGEDGFYPPWTQGTGRWVLQRVLTTVRGILGQTDALAKHAVSDEGLVWVPPHGGVRAVFARFGRSAEAKRALDELQRIPLLCSGCEWLGSQPNVFEGEVALAGSFFLSAPGSKPRPANWRLRCPDCGAIVGPVLDNLDIDIVLRRWRTVGQPRLDSPAAAPMIQSVAPIQDLEQWINKYEPMENELAYVGQQLWSRFADFISDVRRKT